MQDKEQQRRKRRQQTRQMQRLDCLGDQRTP